jgi:hypothetical protein
MLPRRSSAKLPSEQGDRSKPNPASRKSLVYSRDSSRAGKGDLCGRNGQALKSAQACFAERRVGFGARSTAHPALAGCSRPRQNMEKFDQRLRARACNKLARHQVQSRQVPEYGFRHCLRRLTRQKMPGALQREAVVASRKKPLPPFR